MLFVRTRIFGDRRPFVFYSYSHILIVTVYSNLKLWNNFARKLFQANNLFGPTWKKRSIKE